MRSPFLFLGLLLCLQIYCLYELKPLYRWLCCTQDCPDSCSGTFWSRLCNSHVKIRITLSFFFSDLYTGLSSLPLGMLYLCLSPQNLWHKIQVNSHSIVLQEKTHKKLFTVSLVSWSWLRSNNQNSWWIKIILCVQGVKGYIIMRYVICLNLPLACLK